MNHYIVDTETRLTISGNHVVHNVDSGCRFLPVSDHWIDLGEHDSGFSAVVAAKLIYKNAIGCRQCCSDSRLD